MNATECTYGTQYTIFTCDDDDGIYTFHTAAEDAEIGFPGKLVGIEQEIKPCVLKFYDNIDILLGPETCLIIGIVLHGAHYMTMERHTYTHELGEQHWQFSFGNDFTEGCIKMRPFQRH